jgi:hypothetical protein
MAGTNHLSLEDQIENRDFKSNVLMLLYHLNVGYPLLDSGCEFIAPVKQIESLSAFSKDNESDYSLITDPVDNQDEAVYCITPKSDDEGYTSCMIVNPRLSLGLYVKYNIAELPYLVEWKSMRSGDYAFGMLPSNCKPIGREAVKREKGIRELTPFESSNPRIEIGVIDTVEKISEFKKYIADMS